MELFTAIWSQKMFWSLAMATSKLPISDSQRKMYFKGRGLNLFVAPLSTWLQRCFVRRDMGLFLIGGASAAYFMKCWQELHLFTTTLRKRCSKIYWIANLNLISSMYQSWIESSWKAYFTRTLRSDWELTVPKKSKIILGSTELIGRLSWTKQRRHHICPNSIMSSM